MTCSGPHKFTAYRYVGLRTPTCVRLGCDAVNPRHLTTREQRDYDGWLQAIAEQRDPQVYRRRGRSHHVRDRPLK